MQNIKKTDNLAGHRSGEELEERRQREEAFRRDKSGIEILIPASISDDETAREIWEKVLADSEEFGIFDNLDGDTLGSYCSIMSRITSLRKKYLSALNGHRKNADVLDISRELRMLEGLQLNFAGKLGLTPESRLRLAQKVEVEEADPNDELYG